MPYKGEILWPLSKWLIQHVREFYNPGVKLGKALEPVQFNFYLAIVNKAAQRTKDEIYETKS